LGKRTNYDFAGWVTKSDIKCSDGVTIKHDAFRDDDGRTVPLVWNHDYGTSENVLGHVELKNEGSGVYGFGYFNDSAAGENAKKLVKHGDISGMSIGARKLKRNGNDVVHGSIYEVSLVLAGANPGAMIETVVQHNDGGDDEEQGIIIPGTLIHSADDLISPEEDTYMEDEKQGTDLQHAEGDKKASTDPKEKTIEEVIETMNDEQKDAVYALIGIVSESAAINGEDEDEKEPVKTTTTTTSKPAPKTTTEPKGDDQKMKQNIFNKGTNGASEDTITHSAANDVLKHAMTQKAHSLKDFLKEEDTLTHGINSIEMLFPEAYNSTNGNVPLIFKDANTAYTEILDAVTKSPFSRVKTVVADLTEDEARAKGYIKGNMKKEEFFSLIKRTTMPTTVYKKQKLDRDDVIDITDFDVVAFMNVEMQMMLKEEIARALLVGDGRDFSSDDKISEANIRPVIGDHEFFTIKAMFADANAFIESVITAMADYRGSGRPNMYIDPTLLSAVKLLRANDGRFLFGDIPSDEAIANRLGLGKVVPTTFMSGKGAVIVNLRDYTLGATKGGEITNFDDFDIDFNQYKYLIETRLSGALTMPKSAIHLEQGASTTGANEADAGLTYGGRQSGKTTTSTTTLA
jgi:HK97 family phage prohead protease